jgi:hypothetical protein
VAYAARLGGGAEQPVIHLLLSAGEFELLRSLPGRMRDVLLHPERNAKIIARLFPVTHAQDPRIEAEHRRLLGLSLYDRRMEALERFGETLERAQPMPPLVAIQLDEADVDLWLHVVNDVRLMLGLELGIEENGWWSGPEPEGPAGESHRALIALSGIQGLLLEALSGGAAES